MKIAIASGKGGTGKTFVSTNLFFVARETHGNAVVCDCDAEEPNVNLFFNAELSHNNPVKQFLPSLDTQKCIFCGECYDYCSYNAIFYLKDSKVIKILNDLCHGCRACMVACNHGAVIDGERVCGDVNFYSLGKSKSSIIEGRGVVGAHTSVPVVKGVIEAIPQDALAIIDSPPGTSCPFVSTVIKSDYVLLVTEPTPFGLNDLKISVEVLKELNIEFGVVINRDGLGSAITRDWLESEKIDILASIPFDRAVAECYSKGSLIAERDPKYHALFSNLLKKVMGIVNEKRRQG